MIRSICLTALTATTWLAAGGSAHGQATLAHASGAVATQAAGTDGGVGPAALAQEVQAMVAEPAVARAHWGVMVTALDGTPLYGLNQAQFFQPASNTKLYTTAAAMAILGPDTTFETRVEGVGEWADSSALTGDIQIVGGGDANLSGRILPYVVPGSRPDTTPLTPLHSLEEMADAVAATGLKVVVGDVVGDDTAFPWERYPSDWSVDDLVWGYGAPVSALTVNDNQIKVTVTPGHASMSGSNPFSGIATYDWATVTVDPDLRYYSIDGDVRTVGPKLKSEVMIAREPGSKQLRVYGTIASDAAPEVEEVAIDDPAEYAAMAFKAMLETRGITVTGKALPAHRISTDSASFLAESSIPIEVREAGYVQRGLAGLAGISVCDHCDRTRVLTRRVLVRHPSVPLVQDVVVTNKVSQNLHAELLLRHLGEEGAAGGSAAQGARVVRAWLTEKVGIDPGDFVFFDGSGLSGHDLVTPRATARLLSYVAHDPATGQPQPWFAAWKASLPVGGVDGGLQTRFGTAPLARHVFAKTGTLGEARALSGYLDCRSGRTVVFSIMVGNHAPGDATDRDVIDRIVGAIWAAE